MRGTRGKNWRQGLADMFELPQDIMLDLPRLTVIGNGQCSFENHRGIIEYTEEKVRLSVNGGEIVIEGGSLIIRYMTDDEIAVEGNICRIHYEF